MRKLGTSYRATPIQAAARGMAAGLAATALLSVLARILPTMSNQPQNSKPGGKPLPPEEASHSEPARAGQEPSQAVMPSLSLQQEDARKTAENPPGITPAKALAQPLAPGPEGLAAQFAFKFAAGIFDQDITPYAGPAGLGVHIAYGSWWGMLYGLLQASYRRPPLLFGALYGLGVWWIGPGWLVPAMKLMRRPWEEPPLRTAMLVAGHVVYGIALAETFERLDRKGA